MEQGENMEVEEGWEMGRHPAPAAGTQADGVETGNRFEGLPEEDPGEGGDGK